MSIHHISWQTTVSGIEDEGIFMDTSQTIKKALQDVFNKNSSITDISKTAFEIALKQLI